MEKRPGSLAGLEITREEMLYLMHALKADILIGTNPQEIAIDLASFLREGDQDKIVKSLVNKKIIESKCPHEFEVNPDIQSGLDTLFFPEQAIFVMRNRSQSCRQIFYVLQKGKSIVLHSFPKKREHYLYAFSKAQDLYQFLINWFPLFRLPVSASKFDIAMETFGRIRVLAENGKTKEILNLLETTAIDPDEKEYFVQAMAEQKIIGGMSWLSYHEGKVQNEDSLTIVSDGRTGWLISKKKTSDPEEKLLSISRTGADFTAVARDFVERFTNEILPRHEKNSSGIFIRYTLSLDEFAMALAAVNCVELSTKLYAMISRDVKREQYSDRMNKAQQSLIEHGLCTMSERGLPVLDEDLAQAVFSVAKANSQIDITASGGGPVVDTGVYLVHGRFFSAYYNYGEHLQVLEYGKYIDAGIYLKSLFPAFCIQKDARKISSGISLDTMDRVRKIEGNRQETEKVLLSDGIRDTTAQLLAEDFSDSKFRAMLFRKDPPEDKENKKTKKDGKKPNLLFLLKSPRRSWIFQFQEPGSKGTAIVPDQAGFSKTVRELIP